MHRLVPYLAEKKHIVWDWNGTLLNDIDLCVDVVSKILSSLNLPPLDKNRYRQHFGFPIVKYYQAIGIDFNKYDFEKVSDQFVSNYNRRVVDCSLFEGTLELLEGLKSRGVKMSILSAAPEDDLRRLLAQHRIDDHFENIFGLSDHFAVSKLERGKQLIKAISNPSEDLVLVGDTDHDIEVAEHLRVEAVILGDGHQCHTRLTPLHDQVICDRYAQ